MFNNKMTLQFKIDRQHITRLDNFIVTEKSNDYLYAHFVFSDDWNGLTKEILIRPLDIDVAYSLQLDSTNTCKIPNMLILFPGFVISAKGTDNGVINIADGLAVDVELALIEEGGEIPIAHITSNNKTINVTTVNDSVDLGLDLSFAYDKNNSTLTLNANTLEEEVIELTTVHIPPSVETVTAEDRYEEGGNIYYRNLVFTYTDGTVSRVSLDKFWNETRQTLNSLANRVLTIENDYLTSSDKNALEQEISSVASDLQSHTSNKNNPHEVTKSQVGLGNVANYGQTANTSEGSNLYFTSGGAFTLKSSLNQAINDEAQARVGADSQLQTNIDAKQNTIDSDHKLSSDLVDDTNHTHKFATAEQLEQIGTNATNISNEVERATQAEGALDSRLDDIEEVIPSDATTSNKLATESYVDENGGKIDKIEVNSVEQTITNKTVNITVPTKTSDITNDSDFTTKTYVDNELEDKVDKEVGKGLSTNDFNDSYKQKLDNIDSGAEVNVQANWNESDSSSDAYIQNKPSIPTATSDLNNDGDGVSPFATESYVNTYGGKIDKIQAQGVDLPINNKTVNITKASLDIDDIEDVIPSTATSSNKLVTEDDIQYLDSNVHIEGNSDEITYNGDTVTKTSNWKNLETGNTGQRQEVIHLANTTTAGMMSPADYNQIRNNTSRIEALEGQTVRLLFPVGTIVNQANVQTFVNTYFENRGTDPTVEATEGDVWSQNTWYAYDSITATYVLTTEEPLDWSTNYSNYVRYEYEGVAVVIPGTYHIWHYYANNIGWKDDGLDTVTQFTNEIAGVIQGKQADGFVYAENDGTGSVFGWSTLKTAVSNNTTDIGLLQTNKQNKIDSNNPLDADLVDDSSSTNKFVTSQILSDISANTSARHTHSNKSTLDDITAAYTTEEQTKLSNIESGAEVNSIESITLNGTTVTPDANRNVALTDTGATSAETTGNGNAVTGVSYDAATRKLTLTKGSTFALDSNLYDYSTNVIIDEQTGNMSFAITSDVFNKLKTARYATITLTNPEGAKYTFHKLSYSNYDNLEVITFSTTVADGSELVASVSYDGTNYSTVVEIEQVSPTVSGTIVGSYKRLDSIIVDNQTYDLSHTYEKAFTDGSATIASVSNNIVTIKAGVSQTNGAIGNSSGSDIALAKVAKTGSYTDLSDKPSIPTTYIKSASVSGSTLTLTKQDNTTVTFTDTDTNTWRPIQVAGVEYQGSAITTEAMNFKNDGNVQFTFVDSTDAPQTADGKIGVKASVDLSDYALASSVPSVSLTTTTGSESITVDSSSLSLVTRDTAQTIGANKTLNNDSSIIFTYTNSAIPTYGGIKAKYLNEYDILKPTYVQQGYGGYMVTDISAYTGDSNSFIRFNSNVQPASNNTLNLGGTSSYFAHIYGVNLHGTNLSLTGIIKNGSGNYGISVPTTTSYTANKTLATTDDFSVTTTSGSESVSANGNSVPVRNIYYVEGDTTGTSPIWTATSSDITSYYTGLTITFKIGIAGLSGTQTTLNINNLGAKKVFENVATNPSTHYSVGAVLFMVYDETLDSGNGAWKISGDRVGTDSQNVRTYNYTTSNYDRDLLCRQDTAAITAGSYVAKYVATTTKAKINTSTGLITTEGGFAITNGTSSQFLKADGSTDSNTYLTGISSSDVTTALGYTPYNSSNPNGYITGITSSMVTTALGYTPYNSTNPNGYTSNTGTVTSVTIQTSGTGLSGGSSTAITTTGTRTITLDSSSAGNAAANKVVLRNAAGTIQSDTFAVSSSGTTKANITYDSTNECIKITF